MVLVQDFGLVPGQVRAGMEPWELDQLFCDIAGQTSPDVILEIGSRDFMDGLKIKASSPASKVFAFEANPENFSEHLKNINSIIFPLPIALGEANQVGTIRVPRYDSRTENATVQQRGIGSILQRDDLGEAIEYSVPMMTLDTFMGNFAQDCSHFAMWVDVEGYAYQVIKGASADLLKKCLFAKIEVEEHAYWSGQFLASDMRNYMTECGFVEVANCDKGLKQYDILFLNRSLF